MQACRACLEPLPFGTRICAACGVRFPHCERPLRVLALILLPATVVLALVLFRLFA